MCRVVFKSHAFPDFYLGTDRLGYLLVSSFLFGNGPYCLSVKFDRHKEPSVKKKHKNSYLASHQRSWVWGRHAVTEILDAQRWPMRELYLAPEIPEADRARAAERGANLGAVVNVAEYERIRMLCGASDHQGYLARMGPFPYCTLGEILENMPAKPLYVLLDGIRDPHNFGAIIRSAAAFGAAGIITGGEGQAPVNSQTVRASAGALNRLPIAQVEELEPVLGRLRELAVCCIAAVPRADTPIWTCDFTRPAAVLLGNEARGIQPELIAACDLAAAIPQAGTLDSLNVSAAAAAVFYEASRQRAMTSSGA